MPVIIVLGMILVAGVVLFLVGGGVGTLIAWFMHLRRVRARERDGAEARPSSGCGVLVAGFLVGSLLSCGGGLGLGVLFLVIVNSDTGPPSGHSDWEGYEKTEMEHRVKALEPVIAALAKYKADKGRYPTDPNDLITGGYLVRFPAIPRADHQGNERRVDHSSGGYAWSPTQDQFVLLVSGIFLEGPGGVRTVTWVYDSRDSCWRPGEKPAGWSITPLPEK